MRLTRRLLVLGALTLTSYFVISADVSPCFQCHITQQRCLHEATVDYDACTNSCDPNDSTCLQRCDDAYSFAQDNCDLQWQDCVDLNCP